MHSTCPHEREAQQGGIDLLGLLEGLEVDREIDQCIERANGADVACFGAFNPQIFGLAVDAFAGRTLSVDRVVERTVAIQRDALQPPASWLMSLTQPLSLRNWSCSHVWPVGGGWSRGQR